MVATMRLALFLVAGTACSATKMTTNPVRRVVTLLQDMQKKITEEAAKDQALHDQFMCQCSTGKATLEQSVQDATAKVPRLESDIEKGTAEKSQLGQDIEQATKDRVAADTAVAEATSLRKQEAETFEKNSAEASTNIAALTKAVTALEKGMGGAFLQTPMATAIKGMMPSADLGDVDRETLTSFLSGGQGDSDEYSPASGEITGILKQMLETMQKDLDETRATEADAVKQYTALKAAKEKELVALGSAIETKTARLGQVGTELVELAEDLDDTRETLKKDSEFLKVLERDCGNKGAEWEQISKTRSEELIAIGDTIKVLNDDDAADVFKKALPATNLLQLQVSTKDMLREARKALQQRTHGKPHDPRLDLIALAMRGKKVNFDKVLAMIDDMVSLLGKEQTDDDTKKAYCQKEFASAADDKTTLERSISQFDVAISEGKEVLAALKADIENLGLGIQDLDKKVADATTLRKQENGNYKNDMAANAAAQELLNIAKNRLSKFYAPSQYKAPPKQELSSQDRIYVNLGGTPPPTAAPGGIANTGVMAFLQVAKSQNGYAPKTQESGGVMAMIDLLLKDLATEMHEMETNEKDGQADYERFMKESANKREADAKAMSTKEATRAGAEEELLKNEADKKASQKELAANTEYIMGLHQECDWLVANYDIRKKARADEVESMNRAKAVLSGADFAFFQTAATARHLRRVTPH